MTTYNATITITVEANSEAEANKIASDIFDDPNFNYRDDDMAHGIIVTGVFADSPN